MTPQELKNSILQLAIQGKLVEQRPEEGTAEELYRQIQREKAALVKAGKIKKEKPLPEITEEEVPFEIPETWKWERVGNIGSWSAGATPSRTNSDYYYGGDVPWLKTGDLNDSYVTEIPETITKLALEKTSVRLNPVGSVLMAMYGATIGKLGILTVEATTNQACCACIPYNGIYNKYLFYYLMANRIRFIKMGEGGAQPNISKDKIVNSLIAIPPLAEQKRIVAKIEELLPYIDQYEAAWSRLEDFNKRFPTDMQKSILQLAIQGKLVPQRPEEGTGEALYQQIQAAKQSLIRSGQLKKEKPLPEITSDEIPFDIPENWKWVRLADIAYLTSGNQYNETESGIPYLKVADMNLPENKLEITTSSRFTSPDNNGVIPKHSIIFPKRGGAIATNKKKIVRNQPVYIDSNSMGMTAIIAGIFDYMRLWFDSIDMGKLQTGTSVPQINNKDLYPLLFPLPPLAEQKRIVAKLEELLPLCERLQ